MKLVCKVNFITYIRLKYFQFFVLEINCFNGYVCIIRVIIINLIIINLFQLGLKTSTE